MRKKLNQKVQSGIAAAIISLIVLTSSALFVGNLTTTGSAIYEGEFNQILEQTIQIEVWIDTIIQIQEDNGIKVSLTLDNETILSDQELDIYLDSSIIVTEKTNSEGYSKPNFDLYNASPGTYSLRVEFQGLPTLYLNPSSEQVQIEIKEDATIEILVGELEAIEDPLLKEINETIVEEINKTIPNNLICENFTEQVLWSSGYTSKPQGSTEYYSWQPNHTCSEINQPNCVIENIEIKSRLITNAQDGIDFIGEGNVQISEPDKSICNNPKQGLYETYLAYETVKDGEYNLGIYCGKNKNPSAKCAIEIVDGHRNGVSCYGIKTQASQYSIVDVFEIKYNLCWGENNV